MVKNGFELSKMGQKFFPEFYGGGGGMKGFIDFLTTLGVPQPTIMAYVVAGWELVGGLFVAVGILPRIAALGLLGDMIVAVLKVHLRNGFFVKDGGFEYAMTLGAVALAIVLAGSGKYALQPYLVKKKKK